jgi:aryl-alcohol dehydrogenase-like predicted oxidoreductase
MERRQFGKTDMQVSVLGFGGAEIGFDGADDATVATLLHDAIDAGLNVIDTAECYADSEEKIGRALSGRRGDFHLFTKCGHPDGAGTTANWQPDSLLASMERSLKRLKTDHVDLIQLHSCDESELVKGDVIAALQTMKAKGQTRYIGYSGDGPEAVYAIECGAFDSLQTSVNIADQEAIELTLELARKRGVGVIAKRPIANAAWRYAAKPDNAYHVAYWERLRELKYDFLAKDPAKAASIALRFTLGLPGIDTMIVGTSKPRRWLENAAVVAQGPLPRDQSDAIRKRWSEVAKVTWVGLT